MTSMQTAWDDFLARYPAYRTTQRLDELRATEYGRLDALGQIYLDYTGGGIYAEAQLREHMELLADNVFGNPHSINPTSLAMTHLVEQARAAVLAYFNASEEDYEVIFTLNASGALKQLGEAYPFEPGGHYLLTVDNHNSVNGIREFARARGAAVSYLPLRTPELRLDEEALERMLALANPAAHNLFAFPAQSNFSGAQHPLELVEQAQARGWDVLLDAAAFVPTNRLNLAEVRPDYVSISFYKMFGYPTGVGALIARKPALAKLRRPWFAGGTISIASVKVGRHILVPGAGAFEDGTINYLSIPAVEIGLRHIESIGVETIHTRVQCLVGWLLEQLAGLRHGSGAPLVRIHGPATAERRGGTIAFNLYDPEGGMVDTSRIEELAAEAQISLRTGCFCNPGAGEVAYQLQPHELEAVFQHEPMTFQQLRSFLRERFNREISAVRVSVGLASNFADVHRLLEFVRQLLDRSSVEVGWMAQPHAAHARRPARDTP